MGSGVNVPIGISDRCCLQSLMTMAPLLHQGLLTFTALSPSHPFWSIPKQKITEALGPWRGRRYRAGPIFMRNMTGHRV